MLEFGPLVLEVHVRPVRRGLVLGRTPTSPSADLLVPLTSRWADPVALRKGSAAYHCEQQAKMHSVFS